ncbi:MAG: GNAT family N-acetyltransferase [Acidimicrobiia bacterium]|nr:GNAT family N-acetyltransferase [Acidimicrobiia bacterium]
MKAESRVATAADIPVLEALYRGLEDEMAALHPMWPIADGLNEPVGESLEGELDDPDSVVLIGTIDGYPLGFLIARVESLLSQSNGERKGSIRFIFVDHDAREVAVGEAMREHALEILRERGISKFDAHVLPGHRLAKNFFESGGFSARSIIMHHDDNRVR